MKTSICCAYCGAALHPSHPAEQFCSGPCRMAAHRAAHPTPRLRERAMAIIESSLAEGEPSTRAWLVGLTRTIRSEAAPRGSPATTTKNSGYIDQSVRRLDQLITQLNPRRG